MGFAKVHTRRMGFARDLIKEIGDDATNIMSDGLNVSEASGTIDTGSLLLNASLSASLFGGAQDNKITAIAGEEATGKTFVALALVYAFQQANQDGIVVYYDTEGSVTRNMMTTRGIDDERVIIAEKATVQEFRTHLLKLLDAYQKTKKRPRMMVVLDSLGNLSTTKEMEDSKAGKETRDMTRAQIIRGAFRTLALELARSNVSLFVTNHVYKVVGSYIPMDEMGGGGGLKYAASQIIYLTKKKDKDKDGDVLGNIVTVTVKKSRFTRENKKVQIRISYDKGLDRYYGLLDMAVEAGIVKETTKGRSKAWEFPAGVALENELRETPEAFWTNEILQALEQHVHKEFSYGSSE